MVKEIIPQEDNTSEILKADLLKYTFINRRNKLRKNQTNANPANRQELVIKLLEEEHNNLVTDLNVATSKSKTKEDNKYRVKFAKLVHEIKRTEIEWNEQKKIEIELDREIVQLEIEYSSVMKIKKAEVASPKLIFNTDIEYNKLVYEQKQLKTQVESLLKQRHGIQRSYNTLMNKLNKGKQLSSVLSEQVTRIHVYRNDAKERLEMYLKTSKKQIKLQENNLEILSRQLYDDIEMTEFLSQKLKKRPIKYVEKAQKENTDVEALNAEAETFVNHLIYIGDEKNLETIMEEIVKMDIDNKSMFEFLIAIELHLTDVENAMERSRITVADKMREVSDMRAAKSARLASMARTYRDGCGTLRDARRTLQLMKQEWRQTAQAVDEVCDALGANRRGPLDAAADMDDGGDGHRRRALPRRAELSAYFVPVDSRLNDVMYRLYYVQNNRDGGGDDDGQPHHQRHRPRHTDVGDTLSTGSELEDEFVARDIDSSKNRQAKMLAAVDATAMPVNDEQLDMGHVPSLCPECLEKRHEDDLNKGTHFKPSSANGTGESAADTDVENTDRCTRKNTSLGDIEKEGLKTYFHRTVDCPIFYNKTADEPHRIQK